MHEMEEQETNKEKKAKAKAEKERLKAEREAEASQGSLEEIAMLKVAKHVGAYLTKQMEGKGGHQPPSDEKDWAKEICFFCGGKHLVQLRGKSRCPNTVAEERGTAEAKPIKRSARTG